MPRSPVMLPGAKPRNNRSFEYDSLGDANLRFLLEELLPEATKGLNITADPAGREALGLMFDQSDTALSGVSRPTPLAMRPSRWATSKR